MLAAGRTAEATRVRWAFWRKRSDDREAPPAALPDDVGLPRPERRPAAARWHEHDADADADADATDDPSPRARTSGAVPDGTPAASPVPEPSLTAPEAASLDRSALAAAGPGLVRVVEAVHGRGPAGKQADADLLAVAATAALASRLPALSGVASSGMDGAVAFDEPEDELLHAYAEVLAGRAQARVAGVERDDLLAVAHVAAAAASVDAAAEPALLRLAGVPADVQLRAAALLLAQTADDGGAPTAGLAGEVRALFGPRGR